VKNRNPKLHPLEEPADAGELLAHRYGQLLRWATVLTRGNSSKAEEIVQEFCVYIAVAKPDLGGVSNLEGYLYTCLRNIYLSTLARASREALHLVSVEDYDSFAFAISANPGGDLLQRQNELRRICSYAVWRKESSKSASYFILHFFHGYGRREIAELAQLPIAAIYNKLKTARNEVRSYLEEPGKLRIVNRDTPPVPTSSWNLLSSQDLFRELRQTILDARQTDCLPEGELLAHYRSAMPRPVSCALLAHIVSCERCLSLIDRELRRPTLKDREPLDVFGFSPESGGDAAAPAEKNFDAMRSSMQKKWARIHEHRPRTLMIALNGQVIAYHDVRSEHNRLSARIERTEKAQFVEVFSEQNVRLALLDVSEPPPDGPPLSLQRIALSDARWLELSLTYDGLGLQSEVTYFDPALSAAVIEEDAEVALPVFATEAQQPEDALGLLQGLRARLARAAELLFTMVPASAPAWALVLAIFLGVGGYVTYRHTQSRMDAAHILNNSIQLHNVGLQGQTEHQVLRVEESSSDGAILQQGVVVLWRDGDGSRYIRRLYDARYHEIAVEWQKKIDTTGSRRESADKEAAEMLRSTISQYWDQDLSAQAFAAMDDRAPEVRPIDGGYELTRRGATGTHPQLISATLVLDRNLHPIRQIMRVRTGGEVRELRFIQADYERRPSGTVPDATFAPESDPMSPARRGRATSAGHPRSLVGDAKAQQAELEVGALYQLQTLGADTGVPIEVLRSPDGRVQVSGTVPTDALRNEIIRQLSGLAGHELLDLRIVSSGGLKFAPGNPRGSVPVEAYEVTQPGFAADERIRRYFSAEGMSGSRLDAAVGQFSRDALQHAQRALQHAYALDRLGSSVSAEELRAMRLPAQKEWTGMVDSHATGLEAELRSLHAQLAEIWSTGDEPMPISREAVSIDDPVQFARVAAVLLRQVRELNRHTGEFFASSGKTMSETNLDASIQTIMDTIPLEQVEDVVAFTTRLARLQRNQHIFAQTR
jgi:DNA-directed RNA polymerase specialized sigma24 family protein